MSALLVIVAILAIALLFFGGFVQAFQLLLWVDLTHLLGVKPLVTNSFSWEDKRMSKFYGTAGPAITIAERRAADPPMTTHIDVQALSASQWRVCDKRWPEHDARSVLGFIEKRQGNSTWSTSIRG